MVEIERKYLVIGDFKQFVRKQLRITQGYISTNPERVVRIRIQDDIGFITIKGKIKENGFSRFEWEKEIPKDEALELIKLSESGVIEKTRFLVDYEGFTWEVDEFYGDNEGLIIAEIELPDENTIFIKPEWIGEEVTSDKKYYNSNLMIHPFNNWKKRK